MDIRKLQRTIVDALEDVKAQQIAVFNTEALSPLFERIVIASGTSNRQTKALAASVREAVKASGQEVRVEGEDNGEWIIVDCGMAVCHIMQPTIRDYYRLEEIWGGKPVRLKLGGEAKLPKASEPEPAAPARKAAARKATPARAPAAKGPAKKATAKKAPAKPTAAKKTAAAKKPAAKKPAARKAAAVQKVVVHSPRAPKPAAKKKTAARK